MNNTTLKKRFNPSLLSVVVVTVLLWWGGTAAGGSLPVPSGNFGGMDADSLLVSDADSLLVSDADTARVAVGLSATSADTMRVSHFFSTMPDSLLPYLSRNNRLDLIDFMDSGMKAVITNMFEEQSEMTVLTTDSLTLQLNAVHRFDMLLVRGRIDRGPEENLICIRDTYGHSSETTERCFRFFTLKSWQPLDASRVTLSDEKLEREKREGMLGILKWIHQIIKNI
jgi:hypothetical protein